MKPNYVKTMLDRVQGAVGTALGKANALNAQKVDPDLMRYNRLTPQDFVSLRQKFGDEPVLGYIKLMEQKKLKGT